MQKQKEKAMSKPIQDALEALQAVKDSLEQQIQERIMFSKLLGI